MAEEAAEESGGGGGGGDGGSVLKKYGPLAAIVMLAQAVIAFLIIEFVLKENMPEEPQDPLIPQMTSETTRQSGGDSDDDPLPFLYASEDLKTITANPAGTNSERFVVLSVQLGLKASNTEESPPDDDITDKLGENAEVLDKIALYDLKIKSLIMRIIRGKTVDELDAQFQDELEDEIRKVVSTEIFDRLFKTGEGTENTTKVSVVEVNISDIIIQ
jgi:flagellar basal body-associated protein FliL